MFDIEPRGGPRAYTRTERYRFLGEYGSSEDITGGMGIEGVLELQRFVAGGGLLVTLGAASHVPPEYGLTREIDARRPGSGFYAPGPLVEAEIDAPGHPIFYGYETRKIPVRYANGPLLDVPRRFRDDWVVMSFSDGILSGHLRGADQIDGRPAVVDVPRGAGPRRPVRHQPVLPVAEPRRVRDAVQHDPAPQRPGQAAGRRRDRRPALM